ncbi:MAG TPA: flagellar export chaperone FliS [Bryobacteraceae bacterium]|nr:flagellar export chaperone FliS [Bryobacteraceae bacterium]
MSTNPYQTYLQDEILTADPVRLVQILYGAAIEAVGNARRFLEAGDIRDRSTAITKALEILTELSSSLDHKKGGELSGQLAQLYDYMQRRLILANAQQTDGPLAEVERLLRTLDEAWQQILPQEHAISVTEPESVVEGGVGTEKYSLSCAF